MTKITAITVNQWVSPEWDKVKTTENYPDLVNRRAPSDKFYIFSISAYDLKRLSGIYRRDPTLPPAEDFGIQRRHMASRSREILKYVRDGFPLSRIGADRLIESDEIDDLRMPGWIPTSIVANILTEDDLRGPQGKKVNPDEMVTIEPSKDSNIVSINLPEKFNDHWAPSVYPIEIIDGQHRLWAFEDDGDEPDDLIARLKDIQIPVVAFQGLDISWQAYLFYTINQLPKKIDPSMVFDLYPLLRTEDWLLRFEGPNIYRESRAQDLTTILWSHPASPWHERILRLGGREKGKVTQAAFIRSLLASFMKRWNPKGATKIGGLFGAPAKSHSIYLGWSREQQAAFIILIWQVLSDSFVQSNTPWGRYLLDNDRKNKGDSTDLSATAKKRNILFAGPNSLAATDQGVRAYLVIVNDVLWIAQTEKHIDLSKWVWERGAELSDEDAVSDALTSFTTNLETETRLLSRIAEALSEFDWRVSSVIENVEESQMQAAYRGSSGYKLLRDNLLRRLALDSSFLGEIASKLTEQAEEVEEE